MRSYNLLIVTENKPNTSDGIHCSNQMIGWGLWEAFRDYPHVQLEYRNANNLTDIPETDFTLVHSYTPGEVFHRLSDLRVKTRQQMMWISEMFCSSFDYCFTFLPQPGCEQVPLPAPKDLLDASMVGVTKLKGSVLLDHHWSWTDGYTINGPNPNLWCARLYEWLESIKDWTVIGQMESPNHERISGVPIPSWVKRIPNSFYHEYLKATAPYENFIMTHPGSYEHSIVDMAARGIQVLVPTPTVTHKHRDGWEVVPGGTPFAPQDTIDRLKLPTFSTREQLLSLLDRSHDGDWRAYACTDMPEIARQIDAHCKRVLA